ncbi:hypothetical protein BCR33DRAFT_723114 [Rhizoclosmatium globosum]|uniref:Uncharacterized protein n=1 Tax=Rhizoclosmatium globosum TaxID=329046 RepID=A0A1Y2BHC1_9FUNG|nr:hypothetical protein BCR33DRAFT_723114 [Rhizoclosmatium globosum]|eukprot:ORY33907.1 hypothetical protein BCR33DRAFT_723114 [Rhizoclosmatium globosum]
MGLCRLIPSIGLSFYLALSGFFNLGILWSLLKEKESRLSITHDRLSTGKHIRVSTISKIYDTGTNASGRESESRNVI